MLFILILSIIILILTILIINCLLKSKFENTLYNNLIDNKIVKINNSSNIIFVNYFTNNNGYKKYAMKLIETLDYFNLNYYIVELNSLNHPWSVITNFKPHLLLYVMKLYSNYDICWIDADTIIKKYPSYLYNIKKSIAVNCRTNKKYCEKAWSCFIYFKNNNISFNFLNDWKNILIKNKKGADQIPFKNLINSKKYINNLHMLPNNFICKSYDKKNINNAIIIEFEASNSNKNNFVNKPLDCEKGT